MKVEFEISERDLAYLQYASGDSREEILSDLKQALQERIRKLTGMAETDGEGGCEGCGVSWGWSPHAKHCKFHPDNIPSDCRPARLDGKYECEECHRTISEEDIRSYSIEVDGVGGVSLSGKLMPRSIHIPGICSDCAEQPR